MQSQHYIDIGDLIQSPEFIREQKAIEFNTRLIDRLYADALSTVLKDFNGFTHAGVRYELTSYIKGLRAGRADLVIVPDREESIVERKIAIGHQKSKDPTFPHPTLAEYKESVLGSEAMHRVVEQTVLAASAKLKKGNAAKKMFAEQEKEIRQLVIKLNEQYKKQATKLLSGLEKDLKDLTPDRYGSEWKKPIIRIGIDKNEIKFPSPEEKRNTAKDKQQRLTKDIQRADELLKKVSNASNASSLLAALQPFSTHVATLLGEESVKFLRPSMSALQMTTSPDFPASCIRTYLLKKAECGLEYQFVDPSALGYKMLKKHSKAIIERIVLNEVQTMQRSQTSKTDAAIIQKLSVEIYKNYPILHVDESMQQSVVMDITNCFQAAHFVHPCSELVDAGLLAGGASKLKKYFQENKVELQAAGDMAQRRKSTTEQKHLGRSKHSGFFNKQPSKSRLQIRSPGDVTTRSVTSLSPKEIFIQAFVHAVIGDGEYPTVEPTYADSGNEAGFEWFRKANSLDKKNEDTIRNAASAAFDRFKILSTSIAKNAIKDIIKKTLAAEQQVPEDKIPHDEIIAHMGKTDPMRIRAEEEYLSSQHRHTKAPSRQSTASDVLQLSASDRLILRIDGTTTSDSPAIGARRPSIFSISSDSDPKRQSGHSNGEQKKQSHRHTRLSAIVSQDFGDTLPGMVSAEPEKEEKKLKNKA